MHYEPSEEQEEGGKKPRTKIRTRAKAPCRTQLACKKTRPMLPYVVAMSGGSRQGSVPSHGVAAPCRAHQSH